MGLLFLVAVAFAFVFFCWAIVAVGGKSGAEHDEAMKR
jgi:hypothetical protein